MEIIRVCLNLVKEYGMEDRVQGLSFDTTVSNTGIHTGACISLEKGLGWVVGGVGCLWEGLGAGGMGWMLVGADGMGRGLVGAAWGLVRWFGGYWDELGADGIGWILVGRIGCWWGGLGVHGMDWELMVGIRG